MRLIVSFILSWSILFTGCKKDEVRKERLTFKYNSKTVEAVLKQYPFGPPVKTGLFEYEDKEFTVTPSMFKLEYKESGLRVTDKFFEQMGGLAKYERDGPGLTQVKIDFSTYGETYIKYTRQTDQTIDWISITKSNYLKYKSVVNAFRNELAKKESELSEK